MDSIVPATWCNNVEKSQRAFIHALDMHGVYVHNCACLCCLRPNVCVSVVQHHPASSAAVAMATDLFANTTISMVTE